MKKTLPLLATLALVALLGLGCSQSDADATAKTDAKQTQSAEKASNSGHSDAQTASQAGDLAITTLDGKAFSLAEHKGDVVLVNFWATWCPPCRKEIPHFSEMYNEMKDDGLVILGISVDREGEPVVREYMKTTEMTYPVAMGTDGELWNRYQAMLDPAQRGGIPFTIIFDADGNIAHKVVGYRDKAGWTELLKPLLDSAHS